MERRIERAQNIWDKHPNATKSFRLLWIMIDRFTWEDGLTKEELAKIIYKKEIRTNSLHVSQGKMRVTGLLSSLRRSYDNVLVYSGKRINPNTSKREFRTYWHSTQKDIDEIIKMLEKLIRSMNSTIDRVNDEAAKSKEIKKSEYKELLIKLKNKSEKKRKKKK